MLHGGNHTCGYHLFTYSASHKETVVVTKNLNVHCSCFLAQARLFLLLVLFNRGFYVAIRPWWPDSCSLLWVVDVEMCLLLELCEAFIWAAISEAGNSNELVLCSRSKSGFSFPLAFLMRTRFIKALDGFCDCTWRNFQVLEIFHIFHIDWPSCLKVMMVCHFSLLILAALAIIWTCFFTK